MKEKNLLLAVAELALRLAADELPPYSCPKSPHKFTQPQLLACLVLKAHTRQTYRGTQDLLAASSELRQALGLRQVPDHSTLQAFAGRLATPDLVDRLLGRLLGRTDPPVENAAMDATGMESSTASAYYRTRAGKARKAYVKVSVVVLCGCLLPAGLVIGRGPANDKADAAELLGRARAKVRPKRLLADAGYDAEWVHEFCYDEWKVRSYIPPVVHRRGGPVRGRYRARMRKLPKVYGQRWHAESFMSGLKRTMGSQLGARQEATLDGEAALRVLAYAIRR